ncbi:MAG: FAD-dependent oxidoreductase [Thermodesulfobacteriota bacterium]|nr:FAD-dependent oxidoreductase [Thermodesulfobacteriota bacterium]
MSDADYQLIIMGGGPAGLTAGLYAGRAKIKTALLEKGALGGQVLITDRIENYPGFPEGISGFDLIEKITGQEALADIDIKLGATVSSMDFAGPLKKINMDDGTVLTSQTLIIATGAGPNRLNVPGEVELIGKGVSYCATCDGPFYRGLDIAVVGGGNTAIQEAIHLTKFAGKVTVIHRRDHLRAVKILQERAFANDRIDFVLDSVVTSIKGDKEVTSVHVKNKKGEETALPVQGVFVLVGIRPNNEMLPIDQLETKNGFVVTDDEMRTNIPGVMAAGDIRSKTVRQIVNAVGEAAVALQSAEHYLVNF